MKRRNKKSGLCRGPRRGAVVYIKRLEQGLQP
jgi:hypothetical protein